MSGTACPPLALARAREERLIAAMLACKTLAEAAEVAGVSRRTLFRARKDPVFMAKYQVAADELLEGTINQLRTNALRATSTLATIAGDEQQPGNARVRAAEVTLSTLLKATETQDILRRLQRLEHAQEGSSKNEG